MKLNFRQAIVGRPLASLGAWMLILGVVQFFVFHLMVQLAWPEPYSWAHNNISDLGAVGCGPWQGDGRYVCSPLQGWMNASFVLQGLLLAAGIMLARLSDFLTRSSLAFIFLAGLAWALAGFAPADVDEGFHVLAAMVIFLCGNVGLIFAPNLKLEDQMFTVQTYPRTLGTIGLVATALFLGEQYLVFGMGGMERLAVFPLQAWAVLTGIFLLRTWTRLPLSVRG